MRKHETSKADASGRHSQTDREQELLQTALVLESDFGPEALLQSDRAVLESSRTEQVYAGLRSAVRASKGSDSSNRKGTLSSLGLGKPRVSVTGPARVAGSSLLWQNFAAQSVHETVMSAQNHPIFRFAVACASQRCLAASTFRSSPLIKSQHLLLSRQWIHLINGALWRF